MAKIFYSMSGEGRGHATRVRTMVEMLRDRHEIALFAPGDAYDLLAPVYSNSNVRICKIPGLAFHYKPDKSLDYLSTSRHGAAYVARLYSLVRRLEGVIQFERPDLIITDFEPALPRAAHRCGVPFISLTHQHFLVVNDLSSLPGHLRAHARMMGLVVRAYYSGQCRTVVSSFYAPPVKERYRDSVTQIGVLLRPEVLNAAPVVGHHVVAYLRKFAPDSLLDALGNLSREVRVYGLGERPSTGTLRFCKIDNDQFIKDLASATALISTAGNQLVGEALHLRKPVFAMPEANNFEQFINAHFLAQSGAGEWKTMEETTARDLSSFLGRVEHYRSAIKPETVCGNATALEVIEHELANPRPVPLSAKRRAAARGIQAGP